MCATLKTGARADLNETTHSTEMASVTTKFHRQRKSATMEAERLVARSFAVYDPRRLGAVARLPRCRLDRHSKKC